MLIDTHAHLDAYLQSGEWSAVLGRAQAAGVGRIVAVGHHPESNRLAVALAKQHPAAVSAAIGYDRDQALEHPPLPELLALLKEPGVVAVGETGLDYYYSPETAGAQKELFAQMLQASRDHRRPIVIHSRDADDDTLALLSDHCRQWTGDPGRIGVLHCFTGSKTFASRLMDLGFLISFSGIVTFRNAADLRGVARAMPEDRLLIETDSPYLAPVPNRGQRNEPAFVVHVAEALAKIRNDTVEHIAHITAQNAQRLFQFDED